MANLRKTKRRFLQNRSKRSLFKKQKKSRLRYSRKYKHSSGLFGGNSPKPKSPEETGYHTAKSSPTFIDIYNKNPDNYYEERYYVKESNNPRFATKKSKKSKK